MRIMNRKTERTFACTQKFSTTAICMLYALLFMASGCVKPDFSSDSNAEYLTNATQHGEGDPFYYYWVWEGKDFPPTKNQKNSESLLLKAKFTPYFLSTTQPIKSYTT